MIRRDGDKLVFNQTAAAEGALSSRTAPPQTASFPTVGICGFQSESMKTCYMCDVAATGDEHVPPKCIFPKDAKYRVSLIKVPSCDEHNSQKSKCDEYLKFVLTAVGGMNELLGSIFGDSIMRSFDRRPHLINTFTPDLQVVQVGGLETAGFKLDVPRFELSVASVVRGLYFHETGRKLIGKITGVAWEQMRTENYSKMPFLESIGNAEQELPANYVGANPRIFQYAFNISKSRKSSMCRLRFYEGRPIYITWKSDI